MLAQVRRERHSPTRVRDRTELGCAVRDEPAQGRSHVLRQPVRCIAAMTAVTTGRESAQTCRATSTANMLPIMGKVWPGVARSRPTLQRRTLSNVVAIDESPVMEGLLWVGHRRRPGAGHRRRWQELASHRDRSRACRSGRTSSDVFASPRDANTVFVTLNNWQRGDYAPYIVKSTDRGRTLGDRQRQPSRHSMTCGRSRRIT